MTWHSAAEVVDLYIDHLFTLNPGTRYFTAWQLGMWIQSNPDPMIKAWTNQASQILQQHANVQAYYCGTGTRHRVVCTRRGADAPWMIEHAGSWEKALDIKLLQITRDNFVSNARTALPMAKQEDIRAGHVKVKVTSADGPALKACKTRIQNVGYGLNSALVAEKLTPIDIPALLARY